MTQIKRECVNSFVLKRLIFDGIQQPKNHQKTLEILSLTRYCNVLKNLRMALPKKTGLID